MRRAKFRLRKQIKQRIIVFFDFKNLLSATQNAEEIIV